MSSKFYIYASGCWREVELDTGCVSGWGRPNFVYLRGGRLVVAQRSRVLRALRLLAAGRASAAKESCMLSKYIPQPAPTLRRRTKSPVHHQQMIIRSMNDQICAQCNDATFNKILKETNTVATQYVSTADASHQVTKTMIAPPPKNINTNNSILPKKPMPLRNKIGKFIKTKSRNINKRCLTINEGEQVGKGDIEAAAITVKNKEYASKPFKRKMESLNNRRQQLTTKETSKSSEVKELVIEDTVVEILRRYLKKNNLVDLKRFDKDDAYKEHIFYIINPLVVVERCSRIKWMLEHQKNGTDNVSLKEFMSSLGLQTIEDRNSLDKRYKTRASTSQLTKLYSPHSHNHDDKENESMQNVAQNFHKKNAKDSKDYPRFNKIKSSQRCRSPPPKRIRKMSLQRQTEVIELIHSSSDSSSEEIPPPCSRVSVLPTRSSISKPVASAPTVVAASPAARALTTAKTLSAPKPPSATAGKSVSTARTGPRYSGRDIKNRGYSPLEDQAIISWLQHNDRAHLVNGNRLWRELQSEYAARTGVARSWHSLRNRYLRYILPALSSLAPQPVAVQLRAAAATGEVKKLNRKKPVNNSMLVLPRVRSAWAPHRARILSSLSPTPTGTSTPTVSPKPRDEQRSKRLHDSREKTKINKRNLEHKKLRDVHNSSEEEPRLLRPRPSDVSRRSRNPEDPTARILRDAAKKRKLYNPQSVI